MQDIWGWTIARRTVAGPLEETLSQQLDLVTLPTGASRSQWKLKAP